MSKKRILTRKLATELNQKDINRLKGGAGGHTCATATLPCGCADMCDADPR